MNTFKLGFHNCQGNSVLLLSHVPDGRIRLGEMKGWARATQPVGTRVGFEPLCTHRSGGCGCHLVAVCGGRPWHAKDRVGAAVILLHMARRDGKALQDLCFIGT